MHQIELKCVAHGWPDVRIFWRKAGEEMDAETYLFDNQGTARKVSAAAMVCQLSTCDPLSASYGLYILQIDYLRWLQFIFSLNAETHSMDSMCGCFDGAAVFSVSSINGLGSAILPR